ncbi:MAG: lytic transglycosylase domain-containing protein [Brevinematia bacterium]
MSSTLLPEEDYFSCFYNAGTYYGVSPEILMAIAWVESKFNPVAYNKNRDGSYDIGVMQINSRWLSYLKKYGVDIHHLWNPCYNIHIGAMVLRHCIDQHGNTWRAIDCYNKGTKKAKHSSHYVWKVYKSFRYLSKQTDKYTNKGGEYKSVKDWLSDWFINYVNS